MFSFLTDVPGLDDVRALARKVDTARHHGVPDGCILELDLQSVPQETGGFDPLMLINASGRPLLLRETVEAIHRAAEDPRVAGLIARIQIPAASPGPVQELREAIVAFTARKPSVAWAETYPGTSVQTNNELLESIEAQVGTLLNVMIGLLVLALIIAVIGIVNTLALSVLERTREIGLLRAVGMLRSQIRATVYREAVLVAVFGALLGVVIGSFFGWSMVTALADDGIEVLVFPVGRLAVYVVLAAVAGVIAALLPARRAARLDVLDAVTTE